MEGWNGKVNSNGYLEITRNSEAVVSGVEDMEFDDESEPVSKNRRKFWDIF